MNLSQIFDPLILLLLLTLVIVFLYFARVALNLMLQLNERNSNTLSKNFQNLHKSIQDSVQTKFIEISPSTQSLVEASIEVWRLEKRISKVSKDLSDDQNKAFENSITKLKRFLDKSDITFADYTDQKYNEGLNLDVLSIDKEDGVGESVIKETHEPAVFHKGQLIKKAKVVVLEKS